MKVQCDCGAKYALDATPEMLRNPPRFACPSCNVDLSARLLELARQELGNVAPPQREGLAPAPEIAPPPSAKPVVSAPTVVATSPTPAAPIRISIPAPASVPSVSIPSAPRPVVVVPTPIARPPVSVVQPVALPPVALTPPPAPIPSPTAPPPLPPAISGARIHRATAPAAGAATPDVVDTRFCPKHPQQRVTEKCRVCEKPICPKCMQLFGYVCSSLCREKAEANHIKIPTYAGQRDVAQREQGKKTGLIVSLAPIRPFVIVPIAYVAGTPSIKSWLSIM